MALKICRVIALFVFFLSLTPTTFGSRHSSGTRGSGHKYGYHAPHKSHVQAEVMATTSMDTARVTKAGITRISTRAITFATEKAHHADRRAADNEETTGRCRHECAGKVPGAGSEVGFVTSEWPLPSRVAAFYF